MRLSDKNSSQHCKLFPQLFVIYYAFAFLFEEKLLQIWVRNVMNIRFKALQMYCI